jgi:hypothetical protein
VLKRFRGQELFLAKTLRTLCQQRPFSLPPWRLDEIALFFVALSLALAGCRGANQDREAVHQGILDHLAQAGFSNQNMDVSVTSLQFNGDKADALVEITPKGAGPGQGMQIRYGLQQKGSRWVVVNRADAGGHGGAITPGAANPHGSGAMPTDPATGGSGQKMPSPEDLPPAHKKQ